MKLPIRSRSIVTTVLEGAGFGVIVYGIGRISLTAGVIAAGVALILIGALNG